jgi:hypothetical protein
MTTGLVIAAAIAGFALPLCHPAGKLGFYPKHSIQTCLYRAPSRPNKICRFFRIPPKDAAGAWMECKTPSKWKLEE